MKFELKKYPLLICIIISAILIVSSIFVISFAGLKLDSTIAGGSQIEVVLPDDAGTEKFANEARIACKSTNLSLYTCLVEDKYVAGQNNGEYTKRVLVLTIAEKNVNEEKQNEFRETLAEKLNLDVSKISEFKTINNILESKNFWLVGLSLLIIVVCLAIFCFVRYNWTACLSIVIAIIHNIILYFSINSIVRVPLGLPSIAIAIVLTLLICVVLVGIFENYRKAENLHIGDKLSVSERMMKAEKSAIMPYVCIFSAVILIGLLLLISPVFIVRLVATSIIIMLLISCYTSLLLVPAIYVYLLEIRESYNKNRLSRNDEKNRVIKKKIATQRKTKK